MDEQHWRDTRLGLPDPPCLFEQALLADCLDCHCARRYALAERDTIGCASASARSACAAYLAAAAERARFALHLVPGQSVSHAAGLRLRCGGVRALHQTTGAAAGAPAERMAVPSGPRPDVQTTLAQTWMRHGEIDAWPWTDIVDGIRSWRIRPPC